MTAASTGCAARAWMSSVPPGAAPITTRTGCCGRQDAASAGLASCPQDANDLSGLMKRADQRLRVAKAGGRNRVVAREGD